MIMQLEKSEICMNFLLVEWKNDDEFFIMQLVVKLVAKFGCGKGMWNWCGVRGWCHMLFCILITFHMEILIVNMLNEGRFNNRFSFFVGFLEWKKSVTTTQIERLE